MTNVFADTSGWACIVDRDETFHECAKAFYRDLALARAQIVTTNYVLTELVAVMERPLRIPRSEAIRFFESVVHSPQVEVIHVTTAIHDQAWSLLVNRPDKSWSLVDCASFVVMNDLGLTDALTTDHHFEQAGFKALLR